MKNTDISLSKRSYRGTNSYSVHWKANSFPDQREFATEAEAQQFMVALSREGMEKAEEVDPEPWVNQTKELLFALQATPEDLNAYLQELTVTTKLGFARWREYVQESIDLRIKATKLAFNQSITAESYLTKLEAFDNVSLDEVITVYEAYSKAQRETEEVLEDYIGRLRMEEDDEDEVDFVERKLSRFLKSCGFDIFSVEDADVLRFLSDQKGSEAAKRRLEEIVFDFKAFAEKWTPCEEVA